ncbi:ABC transporter substrate-binding protein [Corynebacterium tapiri]|uniref:ABC transporter substrate-binding protein n=1 Tax=Corynebacterium tapiri TaxID=1448266 RepID=A0A5C4U313_9CORY|nr:ABC transporter substrate-binding protein [Corynebacterium tapiri]TNL96066.1 ABC transporter substrate-binding protein [Corynebacterium tapiri]
MRRIAATIAVAALTLTGCATGEDSGASDGTINAAVAYATTNYDPSATSSALALGTNWHVMEGLYELNMADYSVYKGLAAEDEPTKVSDTEYTVSLREGAKFSDGTDVTSADVVHSFERAMKEGNLYASMLNFIDSVEAKDERTVTIKLKKPFSLLQERLAVVKIVPKDATEEQLTSKPVGTGPYKYESIDDARIKAVKNENYNGTKPAGSDAIEWEVLIDDTARTTALQSGSVDVMENVPADNRSQLESAGMTVESKKGFNQPFLIFNTQKAPFNDKRVRQALHYAINTQQLVDNNMSGTATPASSFLPENHPNYHKAATQYEYDPEKAKKLLAEAGVDKLNITLLTTDHTWIENLSPQIKNDLEAVGIGVTLQAQASASLYADNLDQENSNYDVALAPGDPSVFGQDPALLIDWWYGNNVWTQKRSFLQESDPATYQAIRAAVDEGVTLEGDAQQQKWNEALDIIADNAVTYPLFHREMITAYNDEKVSDFAPISTTGLSFLGTKTN